MVWNLVWRFATGTMYRAEKAFGDLLEGTLVSPSVVFVCMTTSFICEVVTEQNFST